MVVGAGGGHRVPDDVECLFEVVGVDVDVEDAELVGLGDLRVGRQRRGELLARLLVARGPEVQHEHREDELIGHVCGCRPSAGRSQQPVGQSPDGRHARRRVDRLDTADRCPAPRPGQVPPARPRRGDGAAARDGGHLVARRRGAGPAGRGRRAWLRTATRPVPRRHATRRGQPAGQEPAPRQGHGRPLEPVTQRGARRPEAARSVSIQRQMTSTA